MRARWRRKKRRAEARGAAPSWWRRLVLDWQLQSGRLPDGKLDPLWLGEAGERLAARALRRRGWRLVGRRVRTPLGEVDLVAVDGGELVVFEVKTGRVVEGHASPWLPRQRLGFRQRSRLERAASWLAARQGLPLTRVVGIEVRLVPGQSPEVLEFDSSDQGLGPRR